MQASTKGVTAIILASLLWGTTGTVASFAPSISPLAIGAFAMGVGGLLLLLSSYRHLIKDYKRLLKQPLVVLFGSASIAVYPLAFYSSMRYSGVAIGTVVSIASAPLFAVLFERIISGKLISSQWLISFVIGAAGIVLMTSGKQHNTNLPQVAFSTFHYIGIGLGLLAGLTYAGYSWSAKFLIDTGIKSQSSIACMFGFASLILLPSLGFTGGNLFENTINTSVSLYMAVVPMFLGYLLFSYGLRLIHASRATLITLIEPLVATLLAILVIGERFTLLAWLGMMLVTICLVLQILPNKYRKN